MIPGEYIIENKDIELNSKNETILLKVTNIGDRPIQVGSHFHFAEVNNKLKFDRNLAYGKRLNIASGTSIRFEPGQFKSVELVFFKGSKKIVGFNKY